MTDKIPARIIQTGKTRDLPLLAKAAAVNIKCLNPDFEYLFFDDAEVSAFVEREFPQYCEAFEAFPFPIQKYDFFRYLAVFHFGGFYFDTDVLFVTGLRKLLSLSCVFSFEELTLSRWLRRHAMDWEIGNYGFGSVPHHPFLDAVIRNCIRAQREPGWVQPMLKGVPRLFRSDYYVLNTTGPGLISRTLVENPHLAEDVSVLFPEDVCDTRTWHQFGSFGIHMMEGSWRMHRNYLRRRLRNLWEAWIMRRVFGQSRRRGKTRERLAKGCSSIGEACRN